MVIGRAEEAVDVDAGNACQGQHDGLRADEAIELHRPGFGPVTGVRERVEEGRVELVGAHAAVGVGLVGHLAAMGEHATGQVLDLRPGEEVAGRHHTDAVVGGQEVEEGGSPGRGGEAARPCRQSGRVAACKGVKDQRCQGKLVDHLRFVAPVAEVADVVALRHVRLGDDLDLRRHLVEHVAEELDQLVGLGEVDAGGARLLPEVGHGVHPEPVGTPLDVGQHDLQHPQQHLRVVVVQVHLVGTKRGPDPARARRGLEAGQQRGRPGTGHHRQVRRRVDGDEEVSVGRLPA